MANYNIFLVDNLKMKGVFNKKGSLLIPHSVFRISNIIYDECPNFWTFKPFLKKRGAINSPVDFMACFSHSKIHPVSSGPVVSRRNYVA